MCDLCEYMQGILSFTLGLIGGFYKDVTLQSLTIQFMWFCSHFSPRFLILLDRSGNRFYTNII